MVMGECNVPYVLDLGAEGGDDEKQDIGHCVNGEIWIADYETMIGLDEYEGVHKGHYKRKRIEVIRLKDDNDDDDEKEVSSVMAYIYVKADV